MTKLDMRLKADDIAQDNCTSVLYHRGAHEIYNAMQESYDAGYAASERLRDIERATRKSHADNPTDPEIVV